MNEPAHVRYHHGDLANACVEAALGLICDEGIDAVTLRAVARQIGASRSAPYRHFADKRALLAACAERGFRDLVTAAESVLCGYTVVDLPALIAVMRRYGEIGQANPALYRLMFAHGFTPAEWPALTAAADAAFATLYGAIQAGQASGHLAAGATYSRVLLVWSSVHGLVSLCNDLAPSDIFDTREFDAHLSAIFDVLAPALAPEPGQGL
ncbi:TetR/AcrR family transcriptional regulator [uncultured Salinisphaera sp.]|uniref:TetR/AcrR family transcriptional regulator n=1 Tax=uncultured Salinisphaera sp. TaxID=359372 RepID=UPI0032B2BC49|tara:strand:+ start:767 stop:1396 length:630 start_codon:yes stop_codon:yes gene_type:complete